MRLCSPARVGCSPVRAGVWARVCSTAMADRLLFRVSGDIEWGPTRVDITAEITAILNAYAGAITRRNMAQLKAAYPKLPAEDEVKEADDAVENGRLVDLRPRDGDDVSDEHVLQVLGL